MKKRVALLVNLAFAALLAGSALAADGAAPADAKAPALSPPAFAALSSAAKETTAQAPVASHIGALKVGYVDLARVATESKTGKAAKAELTARAEKLRGKLEAKQSQLEKQKKAIEAKLPTYTQQQREAKGKEFQKKVEEYQKLLRATEQELQGAEEKIKGKILTDIKEVATSYATSNGFAAVLVKDQMLYLSDTVATEDLTDKISKALDQKSGAK